MRTLSRAQFLRGDWNGQRSAVRPPWSLAEGRFQLLCDGCGDCASACPETIIRLQTNGRPAIDFTRGGCTFCGRCADACAPQAIFKEPDDPRLPWQLAVDVSAACLALRGTSCLCCVEQCPEGVIAGKPALGGKVKIEVDATTCTGCGACIAGCPAGALSVRRVGNARTACGDRSGQQHDSTMHQ